MLICVAALTAPAGIRKVGPPGNDTTPPCGATVTLSGSGGGRPTCQPRPKGAQFPASAAARDMAPPLAVALDPTSVRSGTARAVLCLPADRIAHFEYSPGQ